VAVVRLILAAAALVTVLGLICVGFVPDADRIIDIGAAVFGLASWVIPWLLIAVPRKEPKSSLAKVGRAIGILVVAACLSVMGISLALLTLIFAHDANWAWFTLLAIAAFWVSGAILINVGNRSPRAAKEVSK